MMANGKDEPAGAQGCSTLLQRPPQVGGSGWWRRAVATVATLLVLAVAVGALRHLAADIHWETIASDLRKISAARIAVAVILTVASYVVLTGYDVIALRIIGRHVGYGTTALASFTSYIFSHNFGIAAVTGSVTRWRIYRHKGLNLGEVAQVMVMTGVTFWMGVCLLLGISFIILPDPPTLFQGMFDADHYRIVGATILLLLTAYIALLRFLSGRTLHLFKWVLTLPTPHIAATQFLLAAMDLSLAAGVLFVLLPTVTLSDFPLVLTAYLMAFLAGLIAHAPGGVGVFEATMVLALPHLERSSLFAALLLFRFVYYLLPLAIGLLLFAGHEWYNRRANYPNRQHRS